MTDFRSRRAGADLGGASQVATLIEYHKGIRFGPSYRDVGWKHDGFYEELVDFREIRRSVFTSLRSWKFSFTFHLPTYKSNSYAVVYVFRCSKYFFIVVTYISSSLLLYFWCWLQKTTALFNYVPEASQLHKTCDTYTVELYDGGSLLAHFKWLIDWLFTKYL